jgi:hypothetical protein
VARQRPLVIVCEDLHWADPTSIELLEKLLPLTDRAPLLLLCVFRPETEHGCWRVKKTAARLYRHRHTDLWLDPLTAAESEMLVGNLLRVEGLPQQLRERILGRADDIDVWQAITRSRFEPLITLETRRIETCLLDTLARSGLTADEVHAPGSNPLSH